jgi:CSLREA domain-containing protein
MRPGISEEEESMVGRVGAVMRAVVLVLGIVSVPAAGAAVFTVNSAADEVDATPGNAVCATAGGACTLRAAIQEANALAGTDMVVLPAGTFRLTLIGAGEDLGATGDLDILQSVDISGAGREATIVDGLGADRVFHVVGSSALTLSNLTIRNGDATGSIGGAIFQVGPSPLMLSGVRLEDNHADTGGAVALMDGELTVAGSVFQGNVGAAGAGIFKAGTGFLSISGSEFTANHSAGPGGAVYYASVAAVGVSDSRFSWNTGNAGGALFLASATGLMLSSSHFESSTATGPGASLFYGGTGAVTIAGSTFLGGVASGPGAGCFIATDGSLDVSASEFTDNVATTGPGGGLYFSSSTGGLTVRDTPFRRNTAFAGPGGGIFCTAPGALALTNVEVSDNAAAPSGGGVYAVGQASTTVSAARVMDNSATGGPAGGMFIASVVGDSSITNSTFSGNAAFGSIAGGLYMTGAGAFHLQGSTFSGNQATGVASLGGGIFNASGMPSTVTNSTFSGNLSGYRGGAFYAATAVTFTNTTFSDNGAPGAGGAVYHAAPAVTLVGTILAHSAAGGHCAGAVFTSGGNNVDDGATCALAGTGDQSGVDPMLGPLQDNGGPTQTHALLQGSPAIDAGNGGACPATDQRGVARPTDGNGDATPACDVGAYEFVDACLGDPAKVAPGVCGCGVPDVDANANGAIDCLLNAELKARIGGGRTMLGALTGKRDDSQKALKIQLKTYADDILAYVTQWNTSLVRTDPAADLPKLCKKARKMMRATLRKRGHALQRGRARAMAALDKLDQAVAPQ